VTAPLIERLLHFLVHKGAELLHEVFGADSCIASTATALRVLDYFEIGAYARPVRASLLTMAAYEVTQRETEYDLTGTTPGLYACSIRGTGEVRDNGGRWDGHLVAIVPDGDDQYLLDMTIGQFARPEHGLTPSRAILCPLPDDWDSFAASHVSYMIANTHTVKDAYVLQYQIMTEHDDEGWRKSGDWLDPMGGIRVMTTTIIRAFKDWDQGYDIRWDITLDDGRKRGSVGHVRGGLREGAGDSAGLPAVDSLRQDDAVPAGPAA